MNDLIFEFVRFARVFLPKALMIENVPALLQDDRLKKSGENLRVLDTDAMPMFSTRKNMVSRNVDCA